MGVAGEVRGGAIADNDAESEGTLKSQGLNAAIAFTARTLEQIVQFVVTLLAARFLMPAEFGIYTLAIVFVSLAQTLTYAGVYHYIVVKKGDERTILDTCFWMIAAFGILTTSALAGLAPLVAWLYGAPQLSTVLLLLAAIQPVAAYTAWSTAVLMRHKRMRTHFGIIIVHSLFALAGGVALMVTWKSVYALVAYSYLRFLVGAFLYVAWARLWPGMQVRVGVARDAVKFASSLYATRLLDFFSIYSADLILGLLFSTAEAGLYRFGNRLATAAINIVGQPLRGFALASFGGANRTGTAFGPLLERFSAATLLLTGLVAVTVMLLGEDAVDTLFQPSYLPALGVAYALAAATVLGLGRQMVEPVLAARERTREVMTFHLVWTSLQITAVAIAAPFGITTVAVSQAVVMAAATVRGFSLMETVGAVPIRAAIEAMGRSALLVAAFAAVSALSLSLTRTYGGANLAGLAIDAFGVGLVGLLALGVAYRLRLIDPRIFSSG